MVTDIQLLNKVENTIKKFSPNWRRNISSSTLFDYLLCYDMGSHGCLIVGHRPERIKQNGEKGSPGTCPLFMLFCTADDAQRIREASNTEVGKFIRDNFLRPGYTRFQIPANAIRAMALTGIS